MDDLFFRRLLSPLWHSRHGKQRISLSLVIADASERSEGRANGSNELVNVQLDTRQDESYIAFDRVAPFYESLTSSHGLRRCTLTSYSPFGCCRSAAAIMPQSNNNIAAVLGQ
jgi:hypothetical protein